MQASMKAPADLIILPQWVVPVESEGALADRAVVVQDGRILDVLPVEAAKSQYADTQTLDLHGKDVLDFGCGSGILALAALKLGAAHAVGVDNDPQALLASRDNAERNGVGAPQPA